MKRLCFAILMASLLPAATPAFAADGCKVLLCLSGNWKSIHECVPPVEEVFRETAKGRPFPECKTGGAQTSVQNDWMTSATCPAFYNVIDPETGNWQSCEYVGAATIQIDGQFWSRVYWNGRRKTATEYSANARSALGLDIDPTFDLDARKSRATTRNP